VRTSFAVNKSPKLTHNGQIGFVLGAVGKNPKYIAYCTKKNMPAPINLPNTSFREVHSAPADQSYSGALTTLVVVFFFWGFIAAGNSVFIPFCKHFFDLDQFQSQLIDFAFYTAYYVGALGLFGFGMWRGFDPVTHWGYKKSIVYGLLFSALGALVMILAVDAKSYAAMLGGLFVVGLGFSLQQTAANPFAILLGEPRRGADRVNLGGGVNSFGTAIGPLVVAFALFGSAHDMTDEQIQSLPLGKVVNLYAGVGGLFLAAAALFHFSKQVPSGVSREPIEPAPRAWRQLLIMTLMLFVWFGFIFHSYRSPSALVDESQVEWLRMGLLIAALFTVIGHLFFARDRSRLQPEGWGAIQYPHLVLGMLAIFTYVGVEVSIVSNLSELLKDPKFGALQASEIAPYISMYWGSLMIGRWTGSLSVFNLKGQSKLIATVLVPWLAFGVVLGINLIAGKDMQPLYAYAACLLVHLGATLYGGDQPARNLLVFALFGVTAMLLGMLSTGKVAVYAFLAGGLACSIMWPSIFTLAIWGLGKYAAQGSALLVMMILGGGILPPLQGKLADLVGIHSSYWMAVAAFAYLAWYAWRVPSLLKAQNLE
jgi:FHS family L-fucose permease-like MFS transporter